MKKFPSNNRLVSLTIFLHVKFPKKCHIWRLRDIKVKYSIKWEIKEKAPIYKPGAKECKLCNAEKYHILMEDHKKSLNCRSELLSKCRHKAKWKLVKLL